MAAIIGSKDRKKLAKSIELPTLIIHGDLDPLIKVKNAYATNKLIKGSDLLIVEGMGHLLDLTSYNQFQSQLFKFLKQ
jgi:pimeloyl-ACP methyl ester carboxylesterase